MTTPTPAAGFLTGGFQIQPDGRQALQLSATLWGGVLLFVYIGALALGNFRSAGDYLGPLAGTITGVVIAYGLYLVLKALVGRPRWLAYVSLVIAVVVCGAAQTLADYQVHILLNALMPATGENVRDLQSIIVVGVVYCVLYVANLAMMWITAANRALRIQIARAARAEADGLRTELNALRLKLNPHFMFNALAAASALAGAGRLEETETMLLKLANFLRSSFDVGVDDIPLNDELSILHDYLEVERVRFEDRLQFETDIQPEAETVMIPSLLLQPLVENAVKYGVALSPIPVIVSVSARIEGDRLRITVEDDGHQASAPLTKGTGVGLSATRARLQIRYGADARFEAGPSGAGYRVDIDLPVERPDHPSAINAPTTSFNAS